MNVNEIHNLLYQNGYYSNDRIDYAVYASLICKKPLLIEGDPGVGKTSLPVAVAKALNLPLIRMQMYEGLTEDKVLYDYDYQKQLLVLEAVRPALEKQMENKSFDEIVRMMMSKIDFYGKDFLISRPILQSITSEKRCVLLIDEIDKANDATEYLLYEFLEEFGISIPQYGKICCPEDKKPLVFLTSNNYRPISTALKRRCTYLYIERKNKVELFEILKSRSHADEKTAKGIANCLFMAQERGLRQVPSVSEGLDWANLLASNPERSKEFVFHTLSTIIKNEQDLSSMNTILEQYGESLWSKTTLKNEQDLNSIFTVLEV